MSDFAGVFTGPGEAYERIATLANGISIDLTGRNEIGTWFYADLLLGQGGWMSGLYLAVEGMAVDLPILDAPGPPAPGPTSAPPPLIFVRDLETLVLQNFKLHENVIITVQLVDDPAVTESRNCVVTDPVESLCPFFNRNRIGMPYRITALGDQGSFAETFFILEE
ncbi:MAG TPA: hypothetical protein VMN57_08125 [Anaerolineales bacterium]|nr:hypothetical protein [Anaerolineales bacterium]